MGFPRDFPRATPSMENPRRLALSYTDFPRHPVVSYTDYHADHVRLTRMHFPLLIYNMPPFALFVLVGWGDPNPWDPCIVMIEPQSNQC